MLVLTQEVDVLSQSHRSFPEIGFQPTRCQVFAISIPDT